MKKTIYVLAILIILLPGCISKESDKNKTAPAVPAIEPSTRVFLMFIDDTGSYKLWDQAKSIAGQIINQLKPGDTFYLRRITSSSYTDDNIVFRLELPRLTIDDNNNPFDLKVKKQKMAYEMRVSALKLEARKRLAELKLAGSKKTDIFGCLAVASEKFSLYEPSVKRTLIIASDLQENVWYKPEIDLTGASVLILGFQAMKDPKKNPEVKTELDSSFYQGRSVQRQIPKG